MYNNIEKAIAKAKKELITKANKRGVYENFGQKELRKIDDMIDCYDYSSENLKNVERFEVFRSWCENYTGR